MIEDKKYYKITQTKRIYSRRFNVGRRNYLIEFKRIVRKKKKKMDSLTRLLKTIFEDLVSDLKRMSDIEEGDRMGLEVDHPALKAKLGSIYFPIAPSENYDGETILEEIESIQQSNQAFKLTDGKTKITGRPHRRADRLTDRSASGCRAR